MGGVVKAITNAVTEVVLAPVTITTATISAISNTLEVVGKNVVDNALGLDSLGNEIARWGNDLGQVGKVLSGDYHKRANEIKEYQQTVQQKIDIYNSNLDNLSKRIDHLFAFDEIFKMAASNKLDKFVAENSPEIETMVAELKSMIAQLQKDYDFVIGLTNGPFLQRIIGSIIMIVGGIMNDLKSVLDGSADSGTWKRLITNTLMVIGIVMLFLIPGLQGVALAVAVSLAAITAFMSLDGMYANGAATGAIMGVLDFVFNDVLNLDDLIGKDFNKFDKDNEDYQQMVMFTQVALSLAVVYTAWVNSGLNAASSSVKPGLNTGTASTYNTGVGSQQTSMLAAQDTGLTVNTGKYLGNSLTLGDTMTSSNFLGVSFSTYSDIYKAYSTAKDIGDLAGAQKQYEDLKTKLETDRAAVESAITNKYRKNFMKHYKDSAYFLQDQQEYIDRYLWSMTAQNMYVDPYGTTPVANIRFTPDKDTRLLLFGYEDVFSESTQAGSASYFKSILYGT